MSKIVVVLRLVFVLVAICSHADAVFAKGTDARDVKAREFFTLGKYDQALELYGRLYAESLHPTYLRNVGRCHQMMGDAERAITTFRDYLRRASDLTPAMRTEVEGFIAEMEALRKKRALEKSDQPVTTAVGTPTPPAVKTTKTNVPAVNEPMPTQVDLTSNPLQPHRVADDDDTNWWLWGGAAIVIAGLATTVVLLGNSGGKEFPATDLGVHRSGQ